mgnify:CR=1 FL=1
MGLSPGELRDTLLDLIRRSRLPVPDLAKDAQVDEAQLAAFLQSSAADQVPSSEWFALADLGHDFELFL